MIRLAHIGIASLLLQSAAAVPKAPVCEIWEEEIPIMAHLAVAMDGTVLLFKEQREKGIVEVKRSEDGGATWSAPIKVGERADLHADMSDDGRYKGEHVGFSELANAVVDENTGDIMVFAGGLKPASVLYRSKDHGKTWKTEPIVMKPDKNGWLATTYCCDPGVTLRFGPKKGRLLMPSQVFVGSVGPDGKRTYLNKGQGRKYFAKRYSNALYSDDGGKTWTPSEPFPILGTSEPGLVELLDGSIYYNARTHVRKGNKQIGRSVDAGETWIDGKEDDELFDGPPDEYGCKGALVRLPFDDRDVLVFSSPGRRDKREDITVRVSFDRGETWPVSRVVRKGPGNYTWLAAGRKGTPSEGFIYLVSNKDWMARFNLEWIMEKPFVKYPEKTGAYLERIQRGDRSHAFDKSKDFEEWQKDARSALIELTGLGRMRRSLKDFEPKVTMGEPKNVAGVLSRSLFFIETEPGIVIPFYFLLPRIRDKKQRLPLLLCPHGHDTLGLHSYAGAFKNEDHRQKILGREGNIAEQAARRGYIAIAPATRGLAEEVLVPDPKNRHGNRPCRAQLMHCLVGGRTPVAERVWDMQRLLDWAVKHPNVDPNRIVMTGNSGGGVLTAYTAAIDPRIRVAIPSCSFTSMTSSEGFIFHCDCCMVPGLHNWGGWAELGGLVAPRHLLIVHGVKDGLHHRSDVAKVVRSVREIFGAAEVPDRISLKWGEGGHRFYPDLMWPFIEEGLAE